jgi:hypothetical protein
MEVVYPTIPSIYWLYIRLHPSKHVNFADESVLTVISKPWPCLSKFRILTLHPTCYSEVGRLCSWLQRQRCLQRFFITIKETHQLAVIVTFKNKENL